MTDPELLEIRARCEAATPGPWECTDPMETDKMKVMDTVGEVCKTDLYGFEYPECWSNGDFIAHARTDIPALLAHIDEQRVPLAKVEADKAELVEALEEMVSVAEIIAGFANIPANANGPLIKSRAALAKVKERS